MDKRIFPIIIGVLILCMAMGCSKKEDPEMAALKAQMEALQAQLANAQSGNASAEEIAGLEAAIEEIIEEEAVLEQTADIAAVVPTATAATVAEPSTQLSPTTTTQTTTTTPPAATASTSTANAPAPIVNGTVTIPAGTINLGERVVYEGKNITSVTFPEGLRNITDFANNQITSIIIPTSVVDIGSSAFENNQLTSLTIPNNVVGMGRWAFRNNKLTSVVIGNGITEIDNATFMNNKISTLIIGSSVRKIGTSAFQNNQIKHVTIPASVISIGTMAFADNPLETITFERGGVDIINDSGGWLTQEELIYAFPNGRSLEDEYNRYGAGGYRRNGSRWTHLASLNLDVYGNQVQGLNYNNIIGDAVLHAEPSENSRAIKNIAKGERVIITGEYVNGWCPVEYNGDEGWIVEAVINPK